MLPTRNDHVPSSSPHLWKQRLARAGRAIHFEPIAILAISLYFLAGNAGGQPRQTLKSVDAERFILRDTEGKMRGEWTCKPDAVVLSFFDIGGKPRLLSGLGNDGSAAIEIDDEKGAERLGFHLWPDGGVSLTMLSKNKDKPAVDIVVRADGGPSIFLFDQEGKGRVGFSITPANTVELTLWDKDKKEIFHQGR